MLWSASVKIKRSALAVGVASLNRHTQSAKDDSSIPVLIVGFVLGFLSIGVGLAVLLSVVRVLVPWLQLWHYLVPGYLIILAHSYKVPKLFVGIDFDAGGVASGPMTATFILAFIQGVAEITPESVRDRSGCQQGHHHEPRHFRCHSRGGNRNRRADAVGCAG